MATKAAAAGPPGLGCMQGVAKCENVEEMVEMPMRQDYAIE